jgi:hypothetical protein
VEVKNKVKKFIKNRKKKPLSKKTSVLLEEISETELQGKGAFRLGDLLDLMNERGFGFLFVLFGIIGVLALPPLSLIAAIPMTYFSTQLFLSYDHPYLPKFITEKSFQKSNLRLALKKAIKILDRIEKIVKPRMSFFFSDWAERILGLAMIIFSLSVLMPIPFTNFLPSVSLIFIGLGMIERDGLMTLIGVILGCLGLLVTTTVLILGVEFLEYLSDKMF